MLARFYSNDPLGFRDIHSFNRYVYANNNPYKYTDPSGNVPEHIADKSMARRLMGQAGVDSYNSGVDTAFEIADTASDFIAPMKGLAKLGIKQTVKQAAKRSCCFVAGTQVLTEDGYKNIEDVELGEKLWAKNVETGEQDWKPVTRIFVEPDRGIYEIKLIGQDGFEQKIEATDDHPFFVIGKGWQTTIELEIGDQIETDGNGAMVVISIIDEKRQDLTYNFTVADFHTYYVTEKNVLVHNCNKKASTAQVGDKVQTPDTDADKFTKLGGGQGRKNKKTGEIWQESKTNHSGDSIGEFKVGVKGKPPTKSKKITVTRSDSKVCKKDGC